MHFQLGGFFGMSVRPSPETMSSVLVDLFNDSVLKLEGTHSEGWQSREN